MTPHDHYDPHDFMACHIFLQPDDGIRDNWGQLYFKSMVDITHQTRLVHVTCSG
jgi:hypothetical protein